MTQVQIGRNPDGTVSKCTAKPENVGKGRCGHVGHITMDAAKVDEYIKDENEKVASSADTHKTLKKTRKELRSLGSVSSSYATDKVLPVLSAREIDAIASRADEALRESAESLRLQLDDVRNTMNTARTIDDTLRHEATRRTDAIHSRIHELTEADGPDLIEAIHGKSINLGDYVTNSNDPRFRRTLDDHGAARILGVDGGRIVYESSRGRFYVDHDLVNVQAIKDDYISKLSKQAAMMDVVTGSDEFKGTGRLSTNQMFKIQSVAVSSAFAYKYSRDISKAMAENSRVADRYNKVLKNKEQVDALLVNGAANVREYAGSVNDAIRNRNRVLKAQSLKVDDESAKGEVKALRDAKKWPLDASNSEIIGRTSKDGFIVRQHSDRWYMMSDDNRVRSHGDDSYVTVVSKTGNPLTNNGKSVITGFVHTSDAMGKLPEPTLDGDVKELNPVVSENITHLRAVIGDTWMS